MNSGHAVLNVPADSAPEREWMENRKREDDVAFSLYNPQPRWELIRMRTMESPCDACQKLERVQGARFVGCSGAIPGIRDCTMCETDTKRSVAKCSTGIGANEGLRLQYRRAYPGKGPLRPTQNELGFPWSKIINLRYELCSPCAHCTSRSTVKSCRDWVPGEKDCNTCEMDRQKTRGGESPSHRPSIPPCPKGTGAAQDLRTQFLWEVTLSQQGYEGFPNIPRWRDERSTPELAIIPRAQSSIWGSSGVPSGSGAGYSTTVQQYGQGVQPSSTMGPSTSSYYQNPAFDTSPYRASTADSRSSSAYLGGTTATGSFSNSQLPYNSVSMQGGSIASYFGNPHSQYVSPMIQSRSRSQYATPAAPLPTQQPTRHPQTERRSHQVEAWEEGDDGPEPQRSTRDHQRHIDAWEPTPAREPEYEPRRRPYDPVYDIVNAPPEEDGYRRD